MKNESYSISRDKLIMILYHLNIIVPSLDRIGSCHVDLKEEEFNRLISEFIIDWSVFRRLAEARNILEALMPLDDYEEMLEDIPVWNYNDRKPPDNIKI